MVHGGRASVILPSSTGAEAIGSLQRLVVERNISEQTLFDLRRLAHAIQWRRPSMITHRRRAQVVQAPRSAARQH